MSKNEYVDVIADASSTFYKAKPIYQYDTGVMVRVKNVELDLLEMHWSNGTGKTAIITEPEEVDGDVIGIIPDVMLIQEKDIHCYLYVKKTNIGYTRIEILIPVIPRQKPSGLYVFPGHVLPIEERLDEILRIIENLSIQTTEASEGHVKVSLRKE